jgi:hypothetical protein
MGVYEAKHPLFAVEVKCMYTIEISMFPLSRWMFILQNALFTCMYTKEEENRSGKVRFLICSSVFCAAMWFKITSLLFCYSEATSPVGFLS